MERDKLLRSIAETGYNVGFGAKRHFATYDIVEKTPGWIGFISAAVGIFALVFDTLSAKLPSALLLVAGLISLYVTFYKSAEYETSGKKMTQIFNALRDLYREVESGTDIEKSTLKLKNLESEFYQISISRQILFSDWYAHLKFFGQHQYGWINEQLKFRFWKDKIPATAKLFLWLSLLLLVITLLLNIGLFNWLPYELFYNSKCIFINQ